jgi:hypothetical protein
MVHIFFLDFSFRIATENLAAQSWDDTVPLR